MERGIGLSGGERIRVGIARSILANRSVLLLDEPTASLDAITAKLVQGTIEKLSSDKTTLIVAHNLSSIVHVDQIIVLEKGHIVEVGKYEVQVRVNSVPLQSFSLSTLDTWSFYH